VVVIVKAEMLKCYHKKLKQLVVVIVKAEMLSREIEAAGLPFSESKLYIGI
jgi:hypothetical protein